MKILITDCATLKSNNDLNLDIFKKFGDVAEFDNIPHSELKNAVKNTDIILCNKTVIDTEIMEAAEKLKYIGLFATGYNNIDIGYAKRCGITVCNAGSYSSNAVAQQVIGYILMHYTGIMQYNAFVKQGGWKSAEVFSPLIYSGGEVYGKTLGIVGYGNIGKAVERAAKGLGMRVLVHTRTVRENGETEYTDFDTLLKNSDVVSLHCPLSNETADIMNEKTFAKMKNGAFFVNTSRGGTVDEQALCSALKSGKLSGAAVDVLKREPMAADCVLADAPNIIITPHTAWAPLETRKRLLLIVADNIEAYLNGTPKNRVV